MLEFCIGVLVGLGIFLGIGLWLSRGEEPPTPQEFGHTPNEQQPQMPKPSKGRTMWDLPDPYAPKDS